MLSWHLHKISSVTPKMMILDMSLDIRKEAEYALMKLFKRNFDQLQKKLSNKSEEKCSVDHSISLKYPFLSRLWFPRQHLKLQFMQLASSLCTWIVLQSKLTPLNALSLLSQQLFPHSTSRTPSSSLSILSWVRLFKLNLRMELKFIASRYRITLQSAISWSSVNQTLIDITADMTTMQRLD